LGAELNKLPVLFTCFARPDLLEQSLLSAMNSTIPLKFFFHIDGPRINYSEDRNSIEQCKEIINRYCGHLDPIIKISNENLGVRNAMMSAITWFFNQVDYGMIVEEDVVIHPKAFKLTNDLLIEFQNDFSVGAISLHNNIKEDLMPHDYDLYLSNLTFLWGWATWKNRWKVVSVGINDPFRRMLKYKIHRKLGLFGFLYFLRFFDYKAKFSWDGDLLLNFWQNQYRTILLRNNLAWNIGFDNRATHTKKSISQLPLYAGSVPDLRQMNSFLETQKKTEVLIIRELYGFKHLKLKFQYLKWFIRNLRRLSK
jgi:hypothetical protein